MPEETDAGECEGDTALHDVREGVRRDAAVAVLPVLTHREASYQLPELCRAQARGKGGRAWQDGHELRGLR